MAGGFAGGLIEGLPAGIQLGKAYQEGMTARGITKANDVLAQIEALDPAATMGIPDGEEGPVTGYDGMVYGKLKNEYTKAMRRVTDPQTLKQMEQRLIDFEKRKILGYGQAAVLASQQGDYEGMQKALAAVSFYTDPGSTPEIQITKDGNAVIKDDGGAVQIMTPDNIADYVRMLTDFEGWHALTFDRQKHRDEMEYRNSLLAQEKLKTDAYIANQKSQTDLRAVTGPLELAQLAANIESVKQQTQQRAEAHMVEMDENERKAYNERFQEFDSYIAAVIADPSAISEQGVPPTDPDDLPVGEEAVQSQAQAISKPLTEQSQILGAQAQTEKAYVANMLLNPKHTSLLYAFADGLLQGDPDMRGRDAGNLALMAVSDYALETQPKLYEHAASNYVTDTETVQYDPDAGILKIGKGDLANRYKVEEGTKPMINDLLGVKLDQPQPAQALPEQQGP